MNVRNKRHWRLGNAAISAAMLGLALSLGANAAIAGECRASRLRIDPSYDAAIGLLTLAIPTSNRDRRREGIQLFSSSRDGVLPCHPLPSST
jgi:hypothetical protein